MMDKQVVIPEYIAEWLEYCKKHDFTLFGCFDPVGGFEDLAGETFRGDIRKCVRWCRKESNTFAIAWLDGYQVEKEKRYLVQLRGVINGTKALKHDTSDGNWYMGVVHEVNWIKVYHTKRELEAGGFGGVFNNPMFEVEEMK